MLVDKIIAAVRYAQRPILWRVKRRGGIPDLYERLHSQWFQSLGILTVLDIGANIGQSTHTLRAAFSAATIHAFEPLPECASVLRRSFEGDERVVIHEHALGDKQQDLPMARNTYTPSSSLLEMQDVHRKAFPHAVEGSRLSVRVERLDDIAHRLQFVEPILAKIDVQGFEGHVLDGGVETLSRCKVIILETCFRELYAGQLLFPALLNRLDLMGFDYRGNLDQAGDVTGEILFADSIFVRRD